MNINDWFPNFDLFVMQILPALILLAFIMGLIEFWVRKSKRKSRKPIEWMDVIIWFSALYLIVPIYRIYQYLKDKKSWETLLEELFVTDFQNYMFIMLVVGIIGVGFIFLNMNIVHGRASE